MDDTSRARAIPENVVVVGVDGTERDREVVGWAARSALRRGVGLHAIHAQETMATAYAPVGFGMDAPLLTQQGDEVDAGREVHEHVLERVFGGLDERGHLVAGTSPKFLARSLFSLLLSLTVREHTVRELQKTSDGDPIADVQEFVRLCCVTG